MAQMKCSVCGHADQGNYCSQCGHRLEGDHRIRSLFKEITGPLYQYFSAYEVILRPHKFANLIIEGGVTIRNGFSFLVAGGATAAIFASIFRSSSNFSMPIVSEILYAFAMLTAMVFSTFPIHIFYRNKLKYPAKVNDKIYITMAMFSAGIFSPLLVLMQAFPGDDWSGLHLIILLLFYWVWGGMLSKFYSLFWPWIIAIILTMYWIAFFIYLAFFVRPLGT